MIKTVKKRNDDSHDEDGCSNQRGGIETSVTVCMFPPSLMHLPSTVITASTHAEAHSYDGDKDHKHDAEGCTYEKSGLLRTGSTAGGEHSPSYQSALSPLRFTEICSESCVERSLPAATRRRFLAGAPKQMWRCAEITQAWTKRRHANQVNVTTEGFKKGGSSFLNE